MNVIAIYYPYKHFAFRFHPRWLHDRALKEHVRFTKVYVIDIIIIDIFLCEILDCTAPKRFWSFK